MRTVYCQTAPEFHRLWVFVDDRRDPRVAWTPMRVVFAVMLCLGLLPSRAHAEDVRDALSVAWESFWQQTGYPRWVYKWQAPIRVKFTGASVQRHSAFAMQQLKQVADIAGMPITQVAVDDATANVEVEFVSTSEPLPDKQPCVTNTIA